MCTVAILVCVSLASLSAGHDTSPAVCDETCLFQKDLKVAHRSSIQQAEQAAEEKTTSLDEKKAISSHRPAAASAADESGTVGTLEKAAPSLAVQAVHEAVTMRNGMIEDLVTMEEAMTNEDAEVQPSNKSVVELLLNEVEFELSAERPWQIKNKLLLVLLEVTIVPAFFGVDRCYMGQWCMGVLKALTFGGLGIWALLDNFAVFINSADHLANINVLGFKANFHPETVHPAYQATCLGLSIIASIFFCYFCLGMCLSHREEKTTTTYTTRTIRCESAVPGHSVRRV